MKKKLVYIVIIVAILAAGAGSLFFVGSDQTASPAPGAGGIKNAAEEFTGFSLRDYAGNTVKSSDFRGEPIVVNSWASWCPFCRQELPAFAAVQKAFGDKVRIIAVNRGESLEVAKKYSDAQNTTGQIVFLLDPEDSFYKSIGGFSMPETIFVDKNGVVVEHKRGPMDINEISEKLKKIL